MNVPQPSTAGAPPNQNNWRTICFGGEIHRELSLLYRKAKQFKAPQEKNFIIVPQGDTFMKNGS